jgi:acetoacetate decarboxylase
MNRPRDSTPVTKVLAPVAELPVLEVVSSIHILADLTPYLAEWCNYLRLPSRATLGSREMALAS